MNEGLGELRVSQTLFYYYKKFGNYSEPHSQNRCFTAFLLLMWLLRHINCVKYAYK